MKKRKHLTAILCAAVMLLTGCASSENAGKDNSEPSTAQVGVTEASSETEQPSEDPAPTNDSAENEQSPEPHGISVPVELKKTKRKGLYKLGAYSKDSVDFCRFPEKDRALMLVTDYVSEEMTDYELYDIDRSMKVGEARINASAWALQALDDGYYTYNDTELFIFDDYLGGKKTYELPNDTVWIWLAPDKKFLIVNEYRGASKMYHLGDEELEEVEMSKSLRVNRTLGYDGYSLYATNTKDEHFRIMHTGTVFRTDSDGVEQEEETTVLADSYSGAYSLQFPNGDKKVVFSDSGSETEFEMDTSEKYLVTTDFGETGDDCNMRIYDLEARKATDPVHFKSSVSGAYLSPGGKIFIHSSYFPDELTWSNKAYILDPSELDFPNDFDMLTADGNAPDHEILFKTPEGESEETNALLKELHERFNVDVFFDTADPKGRLTGYTCKPYTGKREEALEALRDFLALSPDELVSQVTGGKGLYVMFSDDIEDPPPPRYGVAGFQSCDFGHEEIVIEVYCSEFTDIDENTGEEKHEEQVATGSLTDLFSHEFMHFLDKGLYEKNEDFYTVWNDLSPDGSYLYSFDTDGDYDEMSRYTMYDFSSDGYGGVNYDAYFTDSYGRINQNEDRAEIGEYLYDGFTSFYAPFDGYPNLTKKAKKLIRLLREAYPCLSKVPKGEWYLERALDKEWCEEKARERDEEYQRQYDAEINDLAA